MVTTVERRACSPPTMFNWIPNKQLGCVVELLNLVLPRFVSEIEDALGGGFLFSQYYSPSRICA
jgi:hypothetical protein